MAGITKEEIILNAVDLFNKYGITAVSTRDIADACGISLGNLTYHFPKKKDLILAAVDMHQKERTQYPSAVNMDFVEFMDYMDKAEKLRIKYSFYFDNFVDLSRMFKEVAIIQKRVHREVIVYFTKALMSFQSKGLLEPERCPGNYEDIACGINMTTAFWGHHVALTSSGPREYAYQKKVVWAMLVPCMTEKGLAEYRQKIEPYL